MNHMRIPTRSPGLSCPIEARRARISFCARHGEDTKVHWHSLTPKVKYAPRSRKVFGTQRNGAIRDCHLLAKAGSIDKAKRVETCLPTL